ncbi:MAG: hypothetical protein M1830_000187 [Pleopsidium flavum]|nr:MAG: hypothetical protein M1830_000187 [Pleopsidium flavum]
MVPIHGRPEVFLARQPQQWSRQLTTRAAAVKLFRENPFSVSLATFFILFGVGTLFYANYVYNTYIIGAFHKFPEPVAQKLRRALYYTNISLSPKDAVKYYSQALQVADEMGMDPFSDEILGVKIQLAGLMEKIQQYQKAIEILETVRKDCLLWVDQLGGKEGNEGKRTRVLGKTIAISVKLGELYTNEYVAETEAAEEKLIWAVETILKEKKRREDEGVKPGEGRWMTDEEIGAALESLGTHYEEKNQHYLAAPLFLQALASSPKSTCHSVVLSTFPNTPTPKAYTNPFPTVNNLSISLAQQIPPPTPGTPPISRPALISNARSWAEKSLAIAASIKPPDRDAECDMGCAVATHNLGEFAEMDGDVQEARRRYEEAGSLAKAIGFEEGVRNSKEGLRRIEGRS